MYTVYNLYFFKSRVCEGNDTAFGVHLPLSHKKTMKLFAKKSLGQHFLNSPRAVETIVSVAGIKRGDIVLEIGPGTGILTRALLDQGAKVVAVEKDHRAWAMLGVIFNSELREGKLQLLEGDILDPGLDPPKGPYMIVANIPYYITGMILEKFLEYDPRPQKMVILVQKEVAKRIIARDKKESILSVSVKVFGKPKILASVSRGSFIPIPRVDSAILVIENISDKLLAEKNLTSQAFFNILKAGFTHKRKYAIRNLEIVIPAPKLNQIWLDLGLNPKIRAEDISVTQWLQITSLVT